jgi:uncharacterized membrane protein/thiol-disulfide isomerase/thioredoxin
MKKALLPLLVLLLILLPAAARAQEQQPVVQAILFYSPSCPHCHDVIENVLPPLKEQYGDQLQLVGVDTTKAGGQALYLAAYELFAEPDAGQGVPVLLVGDTYLVGAADIPAQFPGIIAAGLQNGGIPWPAVPGLREAIPNLPPDAGSAAAAAAPPAAGAADTAVLDDVLAAEETLAAEPPSGMALAWAVMGGMILALGYVVWRLSAARGGASSAAAARLGSWLIPALALAGLGVALYLAYIEITHNTAVCGPVGDCNAVQSSPYAAIFGVPIAVLGALNYLAVLALWGVLRLRAPQPVPWAAAALAALTLFGMLFSIYLTALELFVIDAVCAWCLASAVITTALMLLVMDALLPRVGSRPAKRPSPAS